MTTLQELYNGCRSYRRFKQKAVPTEILREITETARTRASGRNAQPLRYVVTNTKETVAQINPHLHWAAKLPKAIGTPKADEQPTAFVIVLAPEKSNPLVGIDLGIALDTMAITAWQHGVGSCIMAAVDRAALSKIIPVPDGFAIAAVLSLGYPCHTSTIVAPDDEHGLDYYVDENRNYYVPKRPSEDVITFI